VRFQPGKNVFSYRQALDNSGIHVYQAALEADGDTIEDNNRAVGTVVVRGKPQVLLAEKDKAQAQSLAAALRSQNMEVTVVEASQVPKDMAGLQKFDGIVLSNVSSLKLSRAADGAHPRLRPRSWRRVDDDRRRGELRARRLLPHADRRKRCRSPWR
jgi:hypothetical protein